MITYDWFIGYLGNINKINKSDQYHSFYIRSITILQYITIYQVEGKTLLEIVEQQATIVIFTMYFARFYRQYNSLMENMQGFL